ncbi:MAG: hypothetical protein K2Y08_05640 [Alphaproteobacteria bacterium]|nr:hypothetical protein [Alphaproteobacteria bacterium]
MPLNYKTGMRYPLIVDIHGGGAGASVYLRGGILFSSPLEWQIWTAKGYTEPVEKVELKRKAPVKMNEQKI